MLNQILLNPRLEITDWIVIIGYLSISIIISVFFIKHGSENIEDFFVAGRSLPWWLLGTSIAATWFATDAPLAITALVRSKGIYASWLWWYLGTGIIMMVFFFAHYWRRAEILTDAELIELRYNGNSASFLRGFTAAFYGIFKNCVSLGWVILAMLKFSEVMLGGRAEIALVITAVFALIHTLMSGIKGVVILDTLHFTVGILSTILMAILIMTAVGGPSGLALKLSLSTEAPPGITDMLPNLGHITLLEMIGFICLILILWLGQAQGDGFIVQRLFSAKNEKHAIKASLWFALAAIVILTWPWIIIGLGSIILLPISDASDVLLADPELAYPLMILKVLPTGLKGLLVAAFMAAFMSTVDTHLCWGGSYVVNDIYKRFLVKDKTPKHYLFISRVSIVFLLLCSSIAAWQMDSIADAWIYIIEIMSGVAIISMLRWFWWRINAWSEITSMVTALLLANGYFISKIIYYFDFININQLHQIQFYYDIDHALIRAAFILIVSTLMSLLVTFLTKPVENNRLLAFYKKVKPMGWWQPIALQAPEIVVPQVAKTSWLGFGFGVIFLNSILFSVGHLVLGHYLIAFILIVIAIISGRMTLRQVENTTTE